jgi:hypothetical protein
VLTSSLITLLKHHQYVQEGDEFFGYYTFYEGPDSVGSNGYIDYVSEARATDIKIANITYEVDELNVFFNDDTNDTTSEEKKPPSKDKKEPFLYLKTAATVAGPRESVRLEGKRRFNRGLFIIDVRHMPSGCGTWPAFWLTVSIQARSSSSFWFEYIID